MSDRSGIRPKRVAELIQSEISQILIKEFQNYSTGFITVTGVEVSPDLHTACVYISVFASSDPESFLAIISRKKEIIRRSLAAKIRLKYNPDLIFKLDKTSEFQARIDHLLETSRKRPGEK